MPLQLRAAGKSGEPEHGRELLSCARARRGENVRRSSRTGSDHHARVCLSLTVWVLVCVRPLETRGQIKQATARTMWPALLRRDDHESVDVARGFGEENSDPLGSLTAVRLRVYGSDEPDN